MTTIKEIAALAGVSRGTVDRVLNNRGNVNPETAKRIREIITVLDYKPNKAGLVLAAQKKHIKIGVIMFSLDNPFFEDVLKGLKDKSQELEGYNCTVIVKHVKLDVTEQLEAIAQLIAEGVSGIALTPCNDDRIRKQINSLHKKGIPVVTFNTDIEDCKRIAYVGSHYRKSGETAAGFMHLITHGKANIGIITGSSNILCHTERIAGFTNVLHQLSPDYHIVEIIENHDDEFESYEQTHKMLTRHPEINALFFAAAGVYGGCRGVTNLGLKNIPILTFDKVPTTIELINQGLICATICQQPRLQGSKPLDILFDYLSTGVLPEKEYHYVAIDIRIRENI
ncbi:LacI family DNA-binding transcriptional regulator [Lachnospiraceae bacterium OttesenSCG-928-D06]|nr:LacI family DNA-binding transcriptional regulator [Lachnospiraceae bacterium OttesenSCG-928-D06]